MFKSKCVFTLAVTLVTVQLSYSGGGGDPVKGNAKGFWSHGLILGSVAETGTYGCLWPSHEVKLHTGTFLRRRVKDRTEQYLSTYNRTLLENLESKARKYKTQLTTDTPAKKNTVAFHYIHPFSLNIFHRNQSQYWITSQETPARKFSETRSYAKHGLKFEEDAAPPCHSYKGVRHGRIFHVSRWGMTSKVCTIYLEEESVTETTISTPEPITGVSFGSNSQGQPQTRIHTGVHHRQEPDTKHERYSFNVYSESGCQFAEDVALSLSSVSVHYTTDCCDPSWNWHWDRVSRLTVQEHEHSE